MGLDITQQDIEELRAFRTNLDSDNIRWKEKIKEKLLANKQLLYVLDNKELIESDADPDAYFGECILPYYIIHPTQSSSKNFVCYEVEFREEARYNSTIKIADVIFYCLSEQKNVIDQTTYLARHDLMAALIQNEFNWKNVWGCQMHLVSDRPSVTDNDYATRTLVFEGEMPNNMVRTIKGKPNVINNGRLEY